MNVACWLSRWAVAVAVALVWIPSSAQMVSPTMDDGPGPFSYYSEPTDELGVMGAGSGAEVTPEGYLYTGFGELMFFLGPEHSPVSQRIRTLEDGYLPVLSYTVEHLGVSYRFTMFAAALKENPAVVVNFVRVTATNPGPEPQAAFLTTALRYQAEQTTDTATGDNRFKRPIEANGVGQFHQPGEPFSAKWTYACDRGAFLRDGRVQYLYPQQPAPHLSLTLHSHYNRVHPVTATVLDLQPTTPAGAAAYTFVLMPGESRVLDFKMPLIPMKPGSNEAVAMENESFEAEHDATVADWRKITERGMQIQVSESKVVETFKASLIYDLMALNEVEGHAVQTVNQFQYHRFYLRDATDFVHMYDVTGYSYIAARVLSLFPSRQQADGNFLSQPGQYDGWGEAMIAYGDHYRRTHDRAFATSVYPAVVRAVDWLVQARTADPLRVMPKSDVRDNEYVAAHLTGYNFLALDGLKAAIEIAEATDHPEEARRFKSVEADFRKDFFALLDQVSRAHGGAIPPALDAEGWGGTDWGNLLSVTPAHVLDPHDPRVTETLHSSQSRYQEGITTYAEPDDGVFLHHYLTIKNTLTELERDDTEDSRQAIREFYAELLHTSSTHAGFEYAIRPWGSRDFEGNLAPHGWFASDYRSLLRNMMVREEGDTLHLLTAISPEWIGAGKRIEVERAPTTFGEVGFTLVMPTEREAVLTVRSSFSTRPAKVMLHLPWFMAVTSVTTDGVRVQPVNGIVALPGSVREVRIEWSRGTASSNMSYAKTVASYKAEYRKRYEHLLRTGEMSPAVDTWKVPE